MILAGPEAERDLADVFDHPVETFATGVGQARLDGKDHGSCQSWNVRANWWFSGTEQAAQNVWNADSAAEIS